MTQSCTREAQPTVAAPQLAPTTQFSRRAAQLTGLSDVDLLSRIMFNLATVQRINSENERLQEQLRKTLESGEQAEVNLRKRASEADDDDDDDDNHKRVYRSLSAIVPKRALDPLRTALKEIEAALRGSDPPADVLVCGLAKLAQELPKHYKD